MPVNRTIIVGVLIIMASGLYTVLVIHPGSTIGGFAGAVQGERRKTVTKVIVGAYILGIVVSLVDLFGGPFAHVGGLMLMVATLTALYAIIPDIAQRMGQRNTGGGGGGTITRK